LTPDLLTLWSLFSHDLPVHEAVAPDTVPEPYRRLLVHDHHMTVTLEDHHGGPVKLHVLAERHLDDAYARKLLLTDGRTGKVVMLGIMRMDLSCVSQTVRGEILTHSAPLGRILINHGVMRRVEFHRCLRFLAGRDLEQYLTLPTFGRLATLFCDGRPAIELLEIVQSQP